MRPINAFAAVELCLFASVWIAFGVFAFFQIHAWGIEYDRKIAVIARGETTPETLNVLEVRQPTRSQEDSRWLIVLGNGEKTVAWRHVDAPNDIRVGSEAIAYRFGDEYLIPQFDRGGHHWGKWVFLAVGLIPVPIAGGVVLFRILRGRTTHV